MIYSLTPFFNELDVLEIRLAELDPVVDQFILAESPVTHSGKPKPLLLQEHWDRYEAWHHKMTYVVVDDMPEGAELRQAEEFAQQIDSDHWDREKHQRRALMTGLAGIGLDEEDCLFLSDLDEIPHPQVVTDCAAMIREDPDRLLLPLLAMHVYRLRWRWRESTVPIARFFAPELLWRYNGDLEAVRLLNAEWLGGSQDTDALGWHLAYMGDIATKLDALAHRELDTSEHRANAAAAVAEGRDIFDRRYRDAYECPDELMPPYVLANRDRFAHIL